MMLSEKLLQVAASKGLQIATAESCTGGMVAAAITEIAGSSAVMDRGFVTYSNAAKADLLNVRQETLAACGAVSEDVALEMSEGARANSVADIAVSITGIAGPGGSEFKPEGRVCFAISSAWHTSVETIEFGALGRAEVRAQARDHALKLLIAAAQSAP